MAATDELTFEQAYAELELTVQTLERGDLSLAEALAAFERGMRLAAQCDRQLEEAELRVRQIMPDGGSSLQVVEAQP